MNTDPDAGKRMGRWAPVPARAGPLLACLAVTGLLAAFGAAACRSSSAPRQKRASAPEKAAPGDPAGRDASGTTVGEGGGEAAGRAQQSGPDRISRGTLIYYAMPG